MVDAVFLTETVHVELPDERLGFAVSEVKWQHRILKPRTVLDLYFGVVVTPANNFGVLFFLSRKGLTSSILYSLTINSGTLLSWDNRFI